MKALPVFVSCSWRLHVYSNHFWFNWLVWLPISMIGLLIPVGIGRYLIGKEKSMQKLADG